MRSVATIFICSALIFAGTGSGLASTITITFDEPSLSFQHGSVIFDQYAGVEITAENFHRTFPPLAILYDSGGDHPEDPDLEFEPNQWSGGNLSADLLLERNAIELGHLLIIAENNIGALDGVADFPDDEGRRNIGGEFVGAGKLIFDFETALTSVSFDLVDVEPYGGEPGSVSLFNNGSLVKNVLFTELVGDPAFGAAVFGDNHANRFKAIDGDGQAFNEVVFNMGGSGAVDNIIGTPVPEPSTFALMGLGFIALYGISRRHRSRQ